MQAAKPAKIAKPTKPVPACAQPTERFGDDNNFGDHADDDTHEQG